MNFFEHQDQARARTTLLVIAFTLSLVAIVASVVIGMRYALGIAFAMSTKRSSGAAYAAAGDTRVLVGVGLGTCALVLGGTLWKLRELSGGGGSVARMLGGRLVPSGTTDPDERKLVNVVEEMSIASGTPVPAIYVLSDEHAINAFAAGLSPSDAAIGVTRGAIEKLDRDELQGVIAHEFSHILNGDMRLNVRLIGVLFGLLLIGLTGRVICRIAFESNRGSSRSKKGGGVIALFITGATLFVIGYVGVFCGRLVKAAIARQREFLADASAVQFTRNPDGIASALRKIASDAGEARLSAPQAEQASHLFFGNALKPFVFTGALLATHPPIEERIRRISPALAAGLVGAGGASSAPGTGASTALGTGPSTPLRTGRVRTQAAGALADAWGGEGPALAAAGVRGRGRGAGGAAGAFVSRAGLPAFEHVLHGGVILSEIPPLLREAARDPYDAQAVAFALLLSPDDDVRRRQLAQISASGPPGIEDELRRLRPKVDALGPAARLPLLDLALPALRRLTRSQARTFTGALELATAADPAPALFPFALRRSLVRHLGESLQPRGPARPQGPGQRLRLEGFGEGFPLPGRSRTIAQLGDECRTLLGALAASGNTDVEAARAAFEEGARSLDLPAHLPPLAAGKDLLAKLDAALDRLATLGLPGKGRLLEACARVVSHDGKVYVAEAELVRAIADGLGCPVPPLLSEEE